jgi:DNA-binding protein HU-beta
MIKADLITQVAKKTRLTKKDSAAAVDAVFAAITAALSQGDG